MMKKRKKKVDDDNERKLNGPTVQEQLLTLFVLVSIRLSLYLLRFDDDDTQVCISNSTIINYSLF